MGIGILGQSSLIVVVTALSLAATALTRNLRNRLVQSYAVLCFAISGWAFFFFLEKVFGTGTFYRVHLALNLVLAPLGVHFIQVLTSSQTLFDRWFLRASVFYTIAVAILAWTNLGDTPVIRSLATSGPNFILIACIRVLVIAFFRKRKKRPFYMSSMLLPVGISGRTWLYVGGILIPTLAVMDHVRWMGDIIPSVGNVLLCLYLFIINEVIIHQRLLNLSALVSRVALLVFISSCFALIYTLMVAWIDHSPALFILNSFLASFIILMLIEPTKKITNLGLLKIFNRKFLKFEDQVREAEKGLVSILDTQGLASLTLQFLEQTFRAQTATVFVLRSDGTKYHRVRGLRDEKCEARDLLEKHAVVQFFYWMKKRGEHPIILKNFVETELERTTSKEQRALFQAVLQGLEALQANIVIPFIVNEGAKEIVLGFVAFYATQPPEPWDDDWGALSLGYPFFEKAAITIKNFDVYVRLMEKDRLAALGEMAAGLAHEIRNPLGAIKGAAQFLEAQGESKDGEFLKIIVEETNRLNRVVTQFLDFSRPLGSTRLEVSMSDLILKTVALFNQTHKEPNVSIALLQTEAELALIPKVVCNPEQIKQVLLNLIQNSKNALKKVPEHPSPKIQISVEYRSQRLAGVVGELAQTVAISVQDNGPGILEENLQKIFLPFFTDTLGGTGLGLPISARIIESHGGRLDVESVPGETTRFTVYLPLRGRL